MYREKTSACSRLLCPISIFSWIQFEMSTVSWAIKIRFCKRFIVLWALTGANNLSYLFTSNVDFREIIDLLIWLKSLICKELREREVLIKYSDSIVNNLQKKIWKKSQKLYTLNNSTNFWTKSFFENQNRFEKAIKKEVWKIWLVHENN